jgi:leucyl-tRNA synthetase
MGPLERGGEFSDSGIGGVRRFLGRVWELVVQHARSVSADPPPLEARRTLHRTIRQVTDDLADLRYNTAVAALMAYLNTLQGRACVHDEELDALLRMLAPFAPHIAEEMWSRLGKPYSIHQQPFPVASESLITVEQVRVAVQLNGRTRGVINLAPDAPEDQAVAAARQALPHAPGPGRVVYVPGRIINFVS